MIDDPLAAPAAPLAKAGSDGEGFKALKVLEAKERAAAGQLAAAFNPRDTMALTTFGAPQQQGMSAGVEPMLNMVRSKDAGEAGLMLANLLREAKSVDPSLLGRGQSALAGVPIIGRFVNRVADTLTQFEKVGDQIDRIAHALLGQMRLLSQDIRTLDALYIDNQARYRELLVCIAAGEIKLGQLGQEHAQLVKAAQNSGDPMDAQNAADLHNTIILLERRVYDLKLLVVVAQQTGPQIRLIQAGDQALVDKIQQAILMVIPLWKKQMVTAVALVRQGQAVKLQREVSDATNEMLRRNADMLHQGAVQIATEVERGVVDIETLQHTHEQLVATIEDTLKIQEDGRTKRLEGERAMIELQRGLAGQLVDLQARRTALPSPNATSDDPMDLYLPPTPGTPKS